MYSRYHNRTAARRKPHTRRNKRKKIKFTLTVTDHFSKAIGNVIRAAAGIGKTISKATDAIKSVSDALQSQLSRFIDAPINVNTLSDIQSVSSMFLARLVDREGLDTDGENIAVTCSQYRDEVTVKPDNMFTLILFAGLETPPPAHTLKGVTEWDGKAARYRIEGGKFYSMPYAPVERITFTTTLDTDLLNKLLTNEDSTEKSD